MEFPFQKYPFVARAISPVLDHRLNLKWLPSPSVEHYVSNYILSSECVGNDVVVVVC